MVVHLVVRHAGSYGWGSALAAYANATSLPFTRQTPQRHQLRSCLETLPLDAFRLCHSVSSDIRVSVSRSFYVSNLSRFRQTSRQIVKTDLCWEWMGCGRSRWCQWERVITLWGWGSFWHDLCLQLTMSLGTLAGWLEALTVELLSSFFHLFPPHTQTLIRTPSFISIFSGCSSGLWQISIRRVSRTGPSGTLSLCGVHDLSVRRGRKVQGVHLHWQACVFCVSWWRFF